MTDGRVTKCETAIGEAATTSCERCRRRKIKCDRRQPCSRCRKADTDCVRGGTGEKQRPTPRSHVQALENQVASLEEFIQKLAAADHEQRGDMLAGFCPKSTAAPISSSSKDSAAASESGTARKSTFPRSRAGRIRRLTPGTSVHFYGGTSLFQLPLSPEPEPGPELYHHQQQPTTYTIEVENGAEIGQDSSNVVDIQSSWPGYFRYLPHDSVSRRLMVSFFKEQYQYNMCIYREYFLRDFDTGSRRYYSDMLLYAICSLGALATGDPATRELSDVFSRQAQALLPSAFDNPNLTTLQALILLAQRETGHGKASKGWLFCGMAFRLAHEMGLHMDPANWDSNHENEEEALPGFSTEGDRDREVLRRVYWAAFNADKQLSLYFGRPPALYLHESDVRDTIRLPYPPDWEALLETYIAPGTSATAYEDGFAIAGSFIYHTELSKIMHGMMVDLFENRRTNPDYAMVAATVQKTHLSLTKWLSSLPGKLHWNQWTIGKVPACVLHLHMLFHTVMIILHRPPPQLFHSDPDVAASEDVEICYESLRAILRLIRSYARFYSYESLPLDFVQTLSTAASIILMKRHLENTPGNEDAESARSLSLVLDAMDGVQNTWPCVAAVRASIAKACQAEKATTMPPLPDTTNSHAFVNFEVSLSELTDDFSGDVAGAFTTPRQSLYDTGMDTTAETIAPTTSTPLSGSQYSGAFPWELDAGPRPGEMFGSRYH